MEMVIIKGVPVEVPRNIEAEGRDAIAEWHKAQLKAAVPSKGTSSAAIAAEGE